MIVAGFGFSSAATPASLHDALALASAQSGLPVIDALAVPDDKAVAFARFADATGLPVIPVPAAALIAAETVTQSPVCLAARATGSVAEAAALAAAGEGARLIAPRHVSPDRLATCAIARGSRS